MKEKPETPTPDPPLLVMACAITGRPLSEEKFRDLNKYIQQFYEPQTTRPRSY